MAVHFVNLPLFEDVADFIWNAKASDALEGFGYVFVGVAEGDGAAVGAGGGVFGFG